MLTVRAVVRSAAGRTVSPPRVFVRTYCSCLLRPHARERSLAAPLQRGRKRFLADGHVDGARCRASRHSQVRRCSMFAAARWCRVLRFRSSAPSHPPASPPCPSASWLCPVASRPSFRCVHACLQVGHSHAADETSTDRHTRTDARTPTPTTTRTTTIMAHANPACQRGGPIGATVTRWGCMLVQVPAMGDSISEGTIAVWHKKVGDQVMLY